MPRRSDVWSRRSSRSDGAAAETPRPGRFCCGPVLSGLLQPCSGPAVHLADGDAATLLSHVARRFHYEIDRLREKDVTGHTTSREVRRPHGANHLSGTATAIRPHAHPPGVRGGPYPQEPVVVRDILTGPDGAVVRGGGFVPPQESHFELAPGPAHPKVRGAARRLRSRRDVPGLGAGTADAFDPGRRAAAKAFGRRSAS